MLQDDDGIGTVHNTENGDFGTWASTKGRLSEQQVSNISKLNLDHLRGAQQLFP